MRLFGSDHARVEARVSHATHDTESHGSYALGELGFIQTVGDTNYVTSVVAGGRRDEMPRDVRNQRDRDKAKRQIARDEAKASN